MLPIGRFIEKKEYDIEEKKMVVVQEFQEEHVLLDDWVYVGGKWVRVTKIRQQSTNELMYYEDGKLVHVMPYEEMNQMHKDKSEAKPLKLKDLKKALDV